MIKLPANYDKLTQMQRNEVRKRYEILQKGACYFCQASLKSKPVQGILDKPINKKLFPEGFFTWPVHLHHDHVTGMTIGAVHCECNAVMWQYCGE